MRDMPELAELCRIHDVGLDLIERSHDLDDLLEHVLDEYERRLADLGHDTLDGEPKNADEARKLRALVMFSTQAAALKEKAVAAEELRLRAEELERLNERLSQGELMMKALGALSHNINNPLTALLGRAQLLQAKAGDPEVRKAAQVIESSAQRIAEYIRELARVVREGREESLEKLLGATGRPEV